MFKGFHGSLMSPIKVAEALLRRVDRNEMTIDPALCNPHASQTTNSRGTLVKNGNDDQGIRHIPMWKNSLSTQRTASRVFYTTGVHSMKVRSFSALDQIHATASLPPFCLCAYWWPFLSMDR